MRLSRLFFQYHGGVGGFAAHDEIDEVAGTQGLGQGKDFPVLEAAASTNEAVVTGNEMLHSGETVAVKLRLIRLDGSEFLLHRVADVDDEGTMPDALLHRRGWEHRPDAARGRGWCRRIGRPIW